MCLQRDTKDTNANINKKNATKAPINDAINIPSEPSDKPIAIKKDVITPTTKKSIVLLKKDFNCFAAANLISIDVFVSIFIFFITTKIIKLLFIALLC